MTSVDVVLVKPGSQKQLYGELSTSSLTGLEPPLWAALLAAYLRERGYCVELHDAEVENWSWEETARQIKEANPTLAAIVVSGTNPSASTMNMTGAGAILRHLKEIAPEIKTLLMGLHPSALPECTLREEEVSFVCVGEGIYTLPKLVDALKTKGDDYSIEGLWYKKNGMVIANPRAPLVKNLDELPRPAWDLLPMEKYRAHNWHCFDNINARQPYAVIYTSFGCPFRCSFCCINALFGKPSIRYRSPDLVAEEIDYLAKNWNVRNIKILDEMFDLNESHVIELCELIIERKYDLNAWAYARVDTINKKKLKKMKQAGINWLGIGFESGSKKIRDGVSKGRFDNERMKEVVKMIREAGIYIGGNFIFGLPDDTLETMQETLDLAKELNCEYTNFYVAMAYPGSKLYEEAVANNLPLPDSWLGYSQFSYETEPLSTKYLTAAEILRFRDNAFNEFYNSQPYQNMILEKFREETLQHVKDMLKTRLKRRLLGD